MADNMYYVRSRGKVSGPFDLATLQKLIRRGTLTRMQEISNDRTAWSKAGDFADLFPDERPAAIANASVPEPTYDLATVPSATALEEVSDSPSYSAERYFYTQRGSTVGPVPLGVLSSLANNGTISRNDLVWREGDATGVAAWQVPVLSQHFSTLSYATPNVHGTYAGFWRRFGAWVIDAIITWAMSVIIAVVVAFIVGAVMASSNANGLDIYFAGQLTGQCVGLLVFWLYFALFESSSRRATPGKMAIGLVVVNADGERISFGRASGRTFAKILSGIILCIGYFMAGWTEKRQALHDMIADTLVINK